MNPTLTLSDTAVTLSGTVRATVTFPAAATEPTPLLAPESAAAWEIAPAGPATFEAGRWARTYVLDPLAPGDAVPVRFNAFTVNGAPIDVPAQAVKVTTAVTDRSATAARPAAGYEVPTRDPAPSYTGHLAAFAILVGAASLIILARRRNRPSAGTIPANRFAAAEAALRSTPFDAAAFAVALSAAVRSRLPAGELRTTAELKDSLTAAQLRTLELCDRVKFASGALSAAEARDLLAAAQTASP